jgi:4-hydroxybenzoate polyprenyltransferase
MLACGVHALTPSTHDQLKGLIQLTRWKEYVPFVIPLTALGALLAIQPNSASLDVRLIAVTLANILAVAYAFMINDIEDAPDDARDPDRAARNPITMGRIEAKFGYTVCRIIAVITLVLYAVGGVWVFGIGVATLLLSHLYSWRPVRLKAYAVTDILSHSLMLSGLLMLAGYFIYDTAPGWVWFVALSVTLMSVYGQLYNQLRDYDMDKQAGLKNTAIMLGESNTRRAMYLTIALAAACIVVAILRGLFPFWLAFVLVGAVIVSMFFRSQTDMRGTKAADASGAVQTQALMVVNMTISVWLGVTLFQQVFLG